MRKDIHILSKDSHTSAMERPLLGTRLSSESKRIPESATISVLSALSCSVTLSLGRSTSTSLMLCRFLSRRWLFRLSDLGELGTESVEDWEEGPEDESGRAIFAFVFVGLGEALASRGSRLELGSRSRRDGLGELVIVTLFSSEAPRGDGIFSRGDCTLSCSTLTLCGRFLVLCGRWCLLISGMGETTDVEFVAG